MPEDRLFHPRLRLSRKVAQLGWLGRCVWEDMILAADDFGVLPNHPGFLRGGSAAMLEQESEASVAAGIDRVVGAELFVAFQHQGAGFLCDPLWQDFQKIAYPRRTYYPAPTGEVFGKLSKKTRKLFSENHFSLRREGTRLTAKGSRLSANGKEGGSGGKPALAELPGPARFQVNDEIRAAIARCPVLGADQKTLEPSWWQAEVRANEGVDFPAELLKAEAWLATHPERRPKQATRFLHSWFARADRDAAEG